VLTVLSRDDGLEVGSEERKKEREEAGKSAGAKERRRGDGEERRGKDELHDVEESLSNLPSTSESALNEEVALRSNGES